LPGKNREIPQSKTCWNKISGEINPYSIRIYLAVAAFPCPAFSMLSRK
jgi:hypothetical protein